MTPWTSLPEPRRLLALIAENPPGYTTRSTFDGWQINRHDGEPARLLRQFYRTRLSQVFDPHASNGGDEWAAMILLSPEQVIERILEERQSELMEAAE